MSVWVNGSGGWLNVRIRPNTSTIGGMTNGRSVMNSTNGRARGTRSRTQKAVGTQEPMLTMIVIDADDERVARGCSQNRSRVLVRTLP